MQKRVPTFNDHLNEKSLNSYLPKKEIGYSKYLETTFHYLHGSPHERSIDFKTLVKWIEAGRRAGLTINILSRGVGTSKYRILHHQQTETSGDFNEFNKNFINSYDNLQVKTISKRV